MRFKEYHLTNPDRSEPAIRTPGEKGPEKIPAKVRFVYQREYGDFHSFTGWPETGRTRLSNIMNTPDSHQYNKGLTGIDLRTMKILHALLTYNCC